MSATKMTTPEDVNQELAEELLYLTNDSPLYRDTRGYYQREWQCDEGGQGQYVKIYLPDNLQQAAEMLSWPVKVADGTKRLIGLE